jgi:hypothetical protein
VSVNDLTTWESALGDAKEKLVALAERFPLMRLHPLLAAEQ